MDLVQLLRFLEISRFKFFKIAAFVVEHDLLELGVEAELAHVALAFDADREHDHVNAGLKVRYDAPA